MMNLIETAAVPAGALPRAALAEQLRLPGGFPSDGALDNKLDSCLRAALSAIEARTSKALFQRGFTWRLGAWTGTDGQKLPIAPVASLDALSLILRDGSETVLEPLDFRILEDTHAPVLMPRSGVLPALPHGAQIRAEITAGFGAAWEAIPGDLCEAVLILAADYFDMPQSREAGLPGMPGSVQALIEPYRTISLRRIGQ
ncbi:MAG: hypothetical protein AAFN09_00495 [Pseudomonadota bacterium]